MFKEGCHVSNDLSVIDRLLKENMTCAQIMLGGRYSYTVPTCLELLVEYYRTGIELIFHTPLICYAVSEKDSVIRGTLKYLCDLDRVCSVMDRWTSTNYGMSYTPFVVVHAGSSPVDKEEKLRSFCNEFLQKTDHLVLCLENDVGSKEGVRVGSVPFLTKFCRDLASPRVKICVDTNHAWGHESDGFNVDNIEEWDLISDVLGVIHLNSIPEECLRYNHKDRHSETLLESSGMNSSWIREIYNRKFSVPYITERNTVDLSFRDYRWLRV